MTVGYLKPTTVRYNIEDEHDSVIGAPCVVIIAGFELYLEDDSTLGREKAPSSGRVQRMWDRVTYGVVNVLPNN